MQCHHEAQFLQSSLVSEIYFVKILITMFVYIQFRFTSAVGAN